MNILPKKRWHVRTKENIARVRKDEAEAAEKEKQEQQRIETADREARLNVLKDKSKHKLLESGIRSPQQEDKTPATNTHVNLFSDLEHAIKTTNKEHDEDVKNKKEEYEKKIGYLTYLGQDTNEALGKKNWYETLPESSRFSRSSDIKDTYEKLVLKDADGKPKIKEIDVKDGEVSWKTKQRLDPINDFRKYCFNNKRGKRDEKTNEMKSDQQSSLIESSKDKHKNKKKKHSKVKNREDEKRMKLLKLREARLKREQQEKNRTEMFLSGLNGSTSTSKKPVTPQRVKPKYNSQFNPELARQNYH